MDLSFELDFADTSADFRNISTSEDDEEEDNDEQHNAGHCDADTESSDSNFSDSLSDNRRSRIRNEASQTQRRTPRSNNSRNNPTSGQSRSPQASAPSHGAPQGNGAPQAVSATTAGDKAPGQADALGFDPKARSNAWFNVALDQSDEDNDDEESDGEEDKMRMKTFGDLNGGYLSEDGVNPGRKRKRGAGSSGRGSTAARRRTEEDDDDDDGYCWLCMFGDNGEDPVVAPDLSEMIKIYCENVAMMGYRELCQTIAEYHRKAIYEPMQRLGKKCTKLTWRQVKAHFTEHVMDPRLTLIDGIRKIKTLQKKIEEKIRRVNMVTGETMPDEKQVKMYMESFKALKELYTWKVKDMNFYVSNYHIDSEKQRSFVSLHRNFTFEDAPKDGRYYE